MPLDTKYHWPRLKYIWTSKANVLADDWASSYSNARTLQVCWSSISLRTASSASTPVQPENQNLKPRTRSLDQWNTAEFQTSNCEHGGKNKLPYHKSLAIEKEIWANRLTLVVLAVVGESTGAGLIKRKVWPKRGWVSGAAGCLSGSSSALGLQADSGQGALQ